MNNKEGNNKKKVARPTVLDLAQISQNTMQKKGPKK
jgi:hypothetical protein